MSDQITEVLDPQHRDAVGKRGFRQIADRYDRGRPTGGPHREQAGQRAANRVHPAVEAELADQHRVPRRGDRDHLRRGQHCDRQRQVETGTPFGKGGRGQRQGDPLLRPLLSGIDDRGPDPVPRLTHGHVAETDHRGPRQPVGQVCFHSDQLAGHPGQRHRPRSRQRHGILQPSREMKVPSMKTSSIKMSAVKLPVQTDMCWWCALRSLPEEARSNS